MARIRGVIMLVILAGAIVGIVALVAFDWNALSGPEGLAGEVLLRFDTPADPADSSLRSFVIRKGETAAGIANRLEAEGLIENALVMRWMAEYRGQGSDLAAGEYELSPSMRPGEILTILVEGRTKAQPMLTVPEGWRAEQVAETVAQKGIGSAEDFVKLVREATPPSVLVTGRPAGLTVEGYLFPDSYAYDSKTGLHQLLERMIVQFERNFDADMQKRAAEMSLSVHEVVTMASIVEREAVIADERPLIAGVYYNRLKVKMKLQADPTVQYALASTNPESRSREGWWKKQLTYQDLEVDSLYNSYLHEGLPPGPICSPGRASLNAALNPIPSDYLYFVAKPDGSHAFARTLDEHEANVAKYR